MYARQPRQVTFVITNEKGLIGLANTVDIAISMTDEYVNTVGANAAGNPIITACQSDRYTSGLVYDYWQDFGGPSNYRLPFTGEKNGPLFQKSMKKEYA